MTSIAELGIKVDSTDAAQASSDLDKLTDSGKKSEDAAKRTGKSWEQAMSGMAADTQKIVKELQALNAKQDATAQMMITVGRSISAASASFTSAAASMGGYRTESESTSAAQKAVGETADQAKARILAVAQAAVDAAQAETILTNTARGLSEAQQGLVTSASASARAQSGVVTAQREAVTSTEKLAASTVKATSAVDAQQAELQQLLEQIDPTTRALNRLDEQEKKLAQQKKIGALDASTFSEYQAKIDQSRTNLGRFDDSLTRTGNTAKQTAAALRGVPAQFTDIAVSLQGGQNPLTVLLQQGGQLKDMFGGIGPAVRALGGYVLGLVNPFTVAAAAVGTLAYAYFSGSEEAVEFKKSIILTGNAAGTSADSLSNMARQVSATVGTTGAAAEVLAKLAGTGKIASGSFEGITVAALEMEKATGRAVEETIAEFVKIGKDPVAAAKELNDQYNFLTASTYSQIVALKQQGDTIGAAKLLTDTYVDTIKNRSTEVTENLSIWERGWKSLKGEISATADAVKDIGRDQALASQITDAQRRVAAAQSMVNGDPSDTDAKAKLDNSKLELEFLTQQKNTQDAIAKAQGLNAQVQREGIDASTRLKAISDSNLTNEEKRNKLIKEYKRDVEALRKANPNDPLVQEAVVTKTIQNIQDKNKDPKASTAAVNLTELNNSKNQLSLILGEYKNAQKELEAAQKAGLVTQEDYLLKRQALIGNERDEVTAAYQAEIDALEASKGKASTSANQRIQLDQKIADARANMVKAQKEADSELEVIATNEQGRLAKQAQAITNYTDALDQQNVALRRAGSRAADGVGRGDRENAINGELNGIADRANQQRLDLARDKADASRNMSAEEYQAKLDAINKSERDLSETVLGNYEQMSEAQSDWRKGATSAFSNYLESARNVAGQTRDLFTNAFSSMEDAVANFAITGKFSFSDFTKSVLADMARMATRAAASSALSSLFGIGASAVGSYFGGGATSAGSTQAGYTGTDLSGFTPGSVQAKGGAWSGGVQMFANGGAFTNSIVSKPTAFGMAGGGIGVMGEAGEEAIMPLTRTAGGQLGVRAISSGGGGAGNVYNFPVAVSVQTTGEGGATSTEDRTQLGKGIQQAAKTEAETAIARGLQPGGAIWRVISGRG
ncbi:phage tail tape measure protein [Pseudomonas brassicacearum]|uniref:phage tail tape measure protein n=1 Tax=Pseudomonas brassicacearum TaxID=930166 RepID=UPI0005791A3D|nr:phage tail tape measure protein [Pseudomonas brassicacearum]